MRGLAGAASAPSRPPPITMSDTATQAAAPAADENQLIAERREKLKALREVQKNGGPWVVVDGRGRPAAGRPCR